MSSLKDLFDLPTRAIWTALVATTLCACVALSGQTRSVPYDRDFGPGFYELALDNPYPGRYESIAAVNFQDHTVTIFGEDKRVLSKAELRNGWYEHRGKSAYETVKLDSIHYLPSQDTGRQFALVLYTWFAASGSSNTDGVAEVYALEAHQLKLVQQFSWDEHFETEKPYASFDEKSQDLIIRSGHYLPGDAHCCISAVDVITLRWDGQRYAKSSVRVEPSKHGRQGGRKLNPE